MQKTYNVLRFCFSWKNKTKQKQNNNKNQNIFTKREVLSGLNAHVEEDLAEAILIAVQIAWSNEWATQVIQFTTLLLLGSTLQT